MTVLCYFSNVCNVFANLFDCVFQGETVKTESGHGDEAQTTSEGRTRSVRSLGTAELIRPQKLKYFESTCHLTSFSFFYFCLVVTNMYKLMLFVIIYCSFIVSQVIMMQKRSQMKMRTMFLLKTGKRSVRTIFCMV